MLTFLEEFVFDLDLRMINTYSLLKNILLGLILFDLRS